MKIKTFCLLILFFPVVIAVAQGIHSSGPAVPAENKKPAAHLIKWMSFEQAVSSNEKEPKKIFIDLYTEWCGWCKRMDATTFEDPAIASYMNQKFYAVKLDAEMRDTVHFKGNTFVYLPENKVNQIALSLMNNKLTGYPSSVYLNEKDDLLTTYSGYLTPENLMPILQYFGENYYLQMTWEEFQHSMPDKK